MAGSTCTGAPTEVRTLNSPQWVSMCSQQRPPGLATYSGTSFASPYVAALAAMEYRSLDPQKALAVKESLRDNALDLGQAGARRSLRLRSGASAHDLDRRPLMRVLVACLWLAVAVAGARHPVTAV